MRKKLKKRIWILSVLLVMGLLISSCSGAGTKTSTENTQIVTTEQATEATSAPEEQTTEKDTSNIVTMNVKEFDALLKKLPIAVVKTNYLVQDEEYKILYPDALQAILKNNTKSDIKSAVVYFVGWDENNLPVKIRQRFEFDDPTYVVGINYNDINLIPGKKYGEHTGLTLDENNNVKKFKAIVRFYETFEGEIWENPYYDEFVTLYEGVKYSSKLSVEVKLEDSDTVTPSTENAPADEDEEDEEKKKALTSKELDKIIKKQDIAVIKNKYVVQNEVYNSLAPDLLYSIFQNNTKKDIKDVVVAFVGWDENNLPVKIKPQFSFVDPNYIVKVDYEGINLVPGKTFEGGGLSLDKDCNIKTFKSIVVSYVAFDGTTWENPYMDDFFDLYVGLRK